MKYTELEYQSKLLPESIARYIINNDYSVDEYMDLLKDLWRDDRANLLNYDNEKSFVSAVMTQINIFVNTKEYENDMADINKEMTSEDNNMSFDDNWHGLYLNYHLTVLHIGFKYVCTTPRQMLNEMGFQRRSKFTIKALETYFENFGRKPYSGTKQVDIQDCKLDDIIVLK